MDELILEAEAAATTGKQVIDTGTIFYIEFYPGKVKRNGQNIKTGHVYWQVAIYENGKRLRRVSPKKYFADYGYAGATSIEHCPYTGRVTNYWKRQSCRVAGATSDDSGLRGSDEAISRIVDSIEGR